MRRIFAKLLYFAGMLLTITFFIRFAWYKEAAGEMFPTYITLILMIVGAVTLVSFYIVGAMLFED